MIKKTMLLVAAIMLASCSSNSVDTEADYKFDLYDSESIIAITRDKVMLCKGHAMADNYERTTECAAEFGEMAKEGSDYNIAAGDVLKRIELDEKRLDDMTYKKLLGDIDRVSTTQNYLITYIESKS